MPKVDLRYYCYVCGHPVDLTPVAPVAPNFSHVEVKCKKCGDGTHLMLTTCPECKKGVKYILSDFDFPEEVQRLSGAYVKLIGGIKNSLKDVVDEFNVPLPKRWSAKFSCDCGAAYQTEILLPQVED
ncbi:MAG: hypothetical protein ACW98J_04305 [Candidatus Thorarchaeota archaeon]|jgi:hypothetical protein